MDSVRLYMKMKDMPIIGPTATTFLISKVFFAYEITTAFIESAEESIHVFEHSFPLNSESLDMVLREVRDNLDQAISYVADLENNYPTVIKAVHTSKAATVLLKHKKHVLKDLYEEGFVDDTDYNSLRKEIDLSLVNVQIHDFELSEVKFNEVLTECPLFSNLPTSEIVNIRMKATERVFPKGTTLISKGKEVKNVYFVIIGSVKEEFDGFYFVRGLGNVLNPHDFIYGEASRANVKTTSNTKVMQIQDKIIRDLLDKYPDFRRKWMKNVFPYALKIGGGQRYVEKDFTDRELRRFIEASAVVIIKPKENLIMEHGGYIFEGQAQADGTTYTRGNFVSKDKTLLGLDQGATVLKFTDISGLRFEEERISVINGMVDEGDNLADARL